VTTTQPTTERRNADDMRAELRAWLEGNWSLDLTLRDWWARLADAGWAFPTFPEGYGGRGLTQADARVVGEELTRAGAVAPPAGLGQMMGAPVALDFGTDAQKRAWVPALAAGRESWCQLFSEPGAGSDLASLQTRAVRDGDVWIVNGQKVWTSGARTADRGMLVARTNPEAPKHKGITYFVIDMDQPGVDVRPLRQMTGGAAFNEVFFTDAVVPHDRVVGEVHGGWMVAVATLAYERQGIGGRGGGGGVIAGAAGERTGLLDRTVGDLIERAQKEGDEIAMARAVRTPGSMIRLARDRGRSDDPVIRQRLAAMHAHAEAQRISGQRARAAAQQGKQPGPEVSTAKLAMSAQGRRARDVAMEVLGAHGMLLGDDAPHAGRFQQMALSVQSGSIAGGTDEVQRNIVGERVLGLPKEPQVDKDVPFKDLRTGTQGRAAERPAGEG
jgi:alkylation response protein AidB-like acyl-CoA dehydrogenase